MNVYRELRPLARSRLCLDHHIDGVRAIVERLIPGVVVDEVFVVADSLLLGVARQLGHRRADRRSDDPEGRVAGVIRRCLGLVVGAVRVTVFGIADGDDGDLGRR